MTPYVRLIETQTEVNRTEGIGKPAPPDEAKRADETRGEVNLLGRLSAERGVCAQHCCMHPGVAPGQILRWTGESPLVRRSTSILKGMDLLEDVIFSNNPACAKHSHNARLQ